MGGNLVGTQPGDNSKVIKGPCSLDLSSTAVTFANRYMVNMGPCAPDLLPAPSVVGGNLVGTKPGNNSMVSKGSCSLDLSSTAVTFGNRYKVNVGPCAP